MELNNKEEWRDIQGFEGLYQVSNLGNIKSLPRIKYYVDGRIRHNNEKVISLTHKDGYTEVRLHKPKDVKGRIYKVHILVAQAFIPNPENKPYIDHINTVRDDNRVKNLRWCTAKENSNNPLTVKKNKDSSLKRFDRPEEREKLSVAKRKYFSRQENRERFKERMNDPEVRAKALANNPRKKTVRHYNSAGVLIGEYISTNDAARKTGFSQAQVSSYCLGKTFPRDKSIWLYLDDITPSSISERIKKIVSAYSRVYIMQYNKNGEFIRDYPSIRAASKATGISESAIHNCKTGKSKSAGGYIWKTAV